MLDPLTAIGLAGNIVQFVDFSSKIVGKARDIYSSADGSLPENIDAETVAQSLRVLNSKIAHKLVSPSSAQEKVLQQLCMGCDDVTQELLQALESLKTHGKTTRWKSMRQALKSVSSREKLEAISKRLANYREQLNLGFLVALSDRVDLAAVASAKGFRSLEESTQTIIASIIENRSAFESSLAIQTAKLEELQTKDSTKRDIQHTVILETIVQSSDNTSREHIRTRDEVIKVSEEAARLRQDMMMELVEIKALIRATAQASGEKQQKQLKEKASLVSASWFAKEIVYSHLMNELQAISGKSPAPPILQQPSQGLQSATIANIGVASQDLPSNHREVQKEHEYEEQVTMLDCDRCDEAILDVHYHCSICDDDDYDLCEICAQGGARCDDEDHWMLKRFLHDGKITVSPTGALAPKKFYASAYTKAVLSDDPIKKPDRLDSPEYWNAFETKKGASNVGHFDIMKESIKELGFSGHPRDLPKSFLLSVANRFSCAQVEPFKSTATFGNKDSLPLFFIGAHMFPTAIWQRFAVTHKALVSQKTARLGVIAKSMTLGILRGYNRHAVRSQDFPALIPSPESMSQVKGMVIFGLDEFQRRIIDMSEPSRVAAVDVTLEDGTTMQVKACIYVYDNSLEVVPLEEKKWSPSEFIKSESFKSIEQSTFDEEKLLEYGTQDEQTVLAECVKEMGFLESPSQLPKSLLMAISHRFTYEQILRRKSINSVNYRPFFHSGSSMFPAYVLSRTPGVTLEDVAKLITPAILRGYNRHAVRNRDWQALYPSENPKDQVKGIVYFGINHTLDTFYNLKEATTEIELTDGTKMDIQVNVHVWNGKQEDLLPVAEAAWSPSTLLNSAFYKIVATASEAAEDRLAFDQAFRNFQKLDTLRRMQSSSELSG